MVSLKRDACDGCGVCVMVCPHGVLTVMEKKARLSFEERCIECAACQLNCHNNAIEVTKGVGCLFLIVKEDILKLNSAVIDTKAVVGHKKPA